MNDIESKVDIGLLNFHFTNFNYGALLVSYAMQQILRKLGFRSININFVPRDYINSYENESVFYDFLTNFVKRTRVCFTVKDLISVCKDYSSVIVGSDQVWRWHFDFIFFLYWLKGKYRIISYAASFGSRLQKCNSISENLIEIFLKRFDNVSVRESDAIKVCSEKSVVAQKVLDPVLLLERSDLDTIIENYNVETIRFPYIAYLILDKNRKTQLLHEFDSIKDHLFVDIYYNDKGEHNSYGNFINTIKQATFVITDSFHGTVLSILYDVPFLVISRPIGGDNRIISLFSELEISQERFLTDVNNFQSVFFKVINDPNKLYNNVILQSEVFNSINFLKSALNQEIRMKKPINIFLTIKLKLYTIAKYFRRIIKIFIRKLMF